MSVKLTSSSLWCYLQWALLSLTLASLTALLGVWIVLGHLLDLGNEAEVEAAKEMDKRPSWPLGKGKKRWRNTTPKV